MQSQISSTSEDISYQCATWIVLLSYCDFGTRVKVCCLAYWFPNIFNLNGSTSYLVKQADTVYTGDARSANQVCWRWKILANVVKMAVWDLSCVKMQQQKPATPPVCVIICLPLTHRTYSTGIFFSCASQLHHHQCWPFSNNGRWASPQMLWFFL